jgi:DNA processing protein
VLIWEDENSPKGVRNIKNPPLVLYLKSSLKLEDEWPVATEGTCKISPYGRQVEVKIVDRLPNSSIKIVSGLALGVDKIAYPSIINTGGRTLAVYPWLQ